MQGTIKQNIERGLLTNPYEVLPSDVGRCIDQDFGNVAPPDVGRLLFLSGRLIQMESTEQREARLERRR